jgi:hypothetical protein
MVFINSGGQAGLKDQDFQKIIGKVAQIVSDHNSVLPTQLQNWLDTAEPPIVFTQAKMGLEEKVRVWSAINKPYQISLFYKAAPVFVSSEILIDTPRVTDARFSVDFAGERLEEERRQE